MRAAHSLGLRRGLARAADPTVGGAALGMQDETQASACVQIRQTCSAGASPAGVGARDPVAWMAGGRETKPLKPIDKAIRRMVSESPGRNERERSGSLENAKLRRPSACRGR